MSRLDWTSTKQSAGDWGIGGSDLSYVQCRRTDAPFSETVVPAWFTWIYGVFGLDGRTWDLGSAAGRLRSAPFAGARNIRPLFELVES